MLSKVLLEQTEKRTKSARGIKEEYTESHALKWRIKVCEFYLNIAAKNKKKYYELFYY